MDDTNRLMGQKLAAFRKGLNLTATELAEMVGISQPQISRLENGKQGFRSATLTKIAQVLDVHPAYFFIETGNAEFVGDEAAEYSLAKALRQAQFLSLTKKMAALYFNKPLAFGKIAQEIESMMQKVKV